MKKLSLSFVALFLAFGSFAQTYNDTVPVYIRHPEIPVFRILTTDSSWFSKNDLPKGMSTVIVYFSPDCGHCKAKAKQVSEHLDSLRETFFIWASYHPVGELKDFSEKFGLSKCINVKVGRDTRFFIPAYYKATVTPYIAIYNKKGLFSKEFREGARLRDIMEAVK